MPSKSFRLLAVFGLTFLFVMYLAMKLSESLMLFMSEAICSIEPCREMEWKFSLHNLGSMEVFGSYGI